MSGKRSSIARARRRHSRRLSRIKTQEIARAVHSHGETGRESKFDKPERICCPDCMYENRLNLDGRPIPIGRIPLRPSRVRWRPVASAGCETCGGLGSVPLEPLDQVDPYDLGLPGLRSESRIALERVQGWRQDSLPLTA